MQNKLQELTDKLYNEGLSKGRQEGEALLADARKEADEIVAKARKEAEALMEEARKSAEDLRTKVEGDLRMASSQALQATRKDVENLVVAKMADAPVAQALGDADFLKGIIRAVAERFSAQESADIALVLPASLQKELEPFVKNGIDGALKGEVSASFSKKIAGGFTIGPKDGSYFISLTDETFKDLIGSYLRPLTRQFLFGE